MKKLLLSIAILATALIAESDFGFTPSLLIKVGANQIMQSDASAGDIYIDVAEAGFELSHKEKLSGVVILEYDEQSASFAEAQMSYQVSEVISLTVGQFVNNFANLESEALSLPLILEYAETNVAGFQLDITTDLLYGGITVYQGEVSENFKAFVPAIGITTADLINFKVSSRIEILANKSLVDLSTSLTLTPGDKLTLRSEIYGEFTEHEADAGKVLGWYGEFDFTVTEKLSILARADQIIANIDAADKSGQFMIHGGASFAVIEPFRIGLAIGANDNKVTGESDWTPFIAGEFKFEI